MEVLHASIALLASMVLVLAGMVGWLYWQQTRLFQNMNSIIMVIGELARPPPVIPEEVPSAPPSSPEAEPEPEKEKEEDDRVSVEDTPAPETVTGPPEPVDLDSLPSKTMKELREMLTKRGIPFGKTDNKSALIGLLKATA